jgi:hypothetical protein
LSGHEALSEKEVMLILGVNVGDAPAVAQYNYRFFKTRYLERAANHGQGGLRPRSKTILIDVVGTLHCGLDVHSDRRGQKQQGENTDAPVHTGDILSQHEAGNGGRAARFFPWIWRYWQNLTRDG